MVTFDLITDAYNCYTGLQGICEEPNSEIHLYLLSIIFQVVKSKMDEENWFCNN